MRVADAVDGGAGLITITLSAKHQAEGRGCRSVIGAVLDCGIHVVVGLHPPDCGAIGGQLVRARRTMLAGLARNIVRS